MRILYKIQKVVIIRTRDLIGLKGLSDFTRCL